MRHSLRYLLLLAMCAIKVQAATWYVKPAGTGGATSWADAGNDLQAVINIAAAGDSIYIAGGTYLPLRRADATGIVTANDRNNAFVLKNGLILYGGFPASGTPTLTDRNPATYSTILSGDFGANDVVTGSGNTLSITGNGENAFHVLLAPGTDSTVLLDGLTIRGGNANGGANIFVSGYSFAGNFGGGMMNKEAAPRLNNCIFFANSAAYGGGLSNTDRSAPTFNHCSISNNYAYGGIGGGMYNDTSLVTAYHTDCSGNQAVQWGGGIYTNRCSVILGHCRFSGNNAQDGGGMMTDNAPLLQVDSCTFTSNKVLYGGGGMRNNNSHNMWIRRCNFVNNFSSSTGGGMINNNASGTITYCTFSANTAALAGGAIHNTMGPYKIVNCTFLNNNFTAGAFAGRSIYNGTLTTTTITNSILWDDNTAVYNESNSQVTVAYSIVKGGYPGVGNLASNPQFANVAAPAGADSVYGTADDGMALTGCSPAINAGRNDSIPPGMTTDIAGNPAIYNTTVDMGAYEYQQATIDTLLYVDSAVAVSGTGTSWGTAFKTLQEALNLANVCSKVKQVWVKKGTYFPTALPVNSSASTSNRNYAFALRNNLAIYGGFPPSGAPAFADRDATAHTTILSGDFNGDDVVTGAGNTLSITGNSENAVFVLLSPANDSTAILDGFTIKGGNADGSGNLFIAGYAPDSRDGGGMYAYGSSAKIRYCTFTGNAALLHGGGMYNFVSALAVSYCTFINNQVTDSSGMGGGMCNFSDPSISYLPSASVSNCVFAGNSATAFGGGMSNYHVSPAISSCTFSNNSGNSGGGVSVDQGGQATITNCLFTGNSALPGPGGDATGGGIFIGNQSILTNCTFADNTATGAASLGGGIYTQSNTPVRNCVVWGNTATTGPNLYAINGATPAVAYSLVQGGYTGVGNLSADPLFANAANPAGADDLFGTSDDGLYMQAGSPVLNAGNNSYVPAGITTDITGSARMMGTVDMGAYEGDAILPVHLLDFTATFTGNDVRVQWTTASEQNSDHFEIEYAADGRQFSTAGQTPAAGNSSTVQQYRFLHRDAASISAPVLYYRLKQVDKDGVAYYSRVVPVPLPSPEHIVYFPNPVIQGKALTLRAGSIKQVTLCNIYGQQVWSGQYNDLAAVQIPTTGLATGSYILKVNHVITGKLIVQLAD